MLTALSRCLLSINIFCLINDQSIHASLSLPLLFPHLSPKHNSLLCVFPFCLSINTEILLSPNHFYVLRSSSIILVSHIYSKTTTCLVMITLLGILFPISHWMIVICSCAGVVWYGKKIPLSRKPCLGNFPYILEYIYNDYIIS